MPRTVRVGVVPGGLSEFITVQAAIDWCATQAAPAPSAATPYTVEIWPGVYTEALTLADHINLVGIDKDACIINIDHATLVTMAEGCRISNLTLDVTSDATASGTGIELNDAACTIEDINIFLHRSAGAWATGILESTGATARTINIRNVRCQMSNNTNERGIVILQAGKTVYIEESWIQGSDYGLAIGVSAGAAVASTIYSSHNHFEATSAVSRSVFNNGGTIIMNGDTIGKVDHTGAGITRENDGIITYKNIPLQYEVFAGMSVQDAITSAAADAPAPAATAPYNVMIHPGIYNEAITCATWVNLKGIGPKGSVVIYQNDANIVILADNVQIANLTLRMGTPTANKYFILDNAAACTARMSDLIFEVTTPGVAGIQLFRFTAAGDYTIESCSSNIGGTGSSFTEVNTALATVRFLHNDFIWANVNAFHIHSTNAGNSITGSGNRWAGACGWATITLGTVLLNNDAVVCTGDMNITGGSVCLKNGQQEYHVWAGMLVQHAITAATADTPAPSATAPYIVLIHPGIYDEVIACADWVNLKGIGPKGSVVIQQTDTSIITLKDCELDNFTLRLVTPTAARYLIQDAALAQHARMINLVLEITTPGAFAHNLFRFQGAGDYTIERCSCDIGGTGATRTVLNAGSGATLHLNNNYFSHTNVNAEHIFSNIAGTWTGGGNRWAGTCVMFQVSLGTFTFDNDAMICTGAWTNTGSTITLRNCAIEAAVVAGNTALVRLKNCSYRVITRTGTGNIVDESPRPASYAFHVAKKPMLSLDNIATRLALAGSATLGGTGQLVLRINDNVLDAAGIENNVDAAGALASTFLPVRTPRYCQQISANAFRATTTMFFGLRAVLGAAVPTIAEHHAGFIWDGTNFTASNSVGDGANIQTTNLAIPSTGAQHQLEVIILGGVKVEYYVYGVLVATHATVAALPTAALHFQEYEISDGGGGGTTSDVTLREGFIQECPA